MDRLLGLGDINGVNLIDQKGQMWTSGLKSHQIKVSTFKALGGLPRSHAVNQKLYSLSTAALCRILREDWASAKEIGAEVIKHSEETGTEVPEQKRQGPRTDITFLGIKWTQDGEQIPEKVLLTWRNYRIQLMLRNYRLYWELFVPGGDVPQGSPLQRGRCRTARKASSAAAGISSASQPVRVRSSSSAICSLGIGSPWSYRRAPGIF